MAKPRTEWRPLPHEPIQKLSENLWWVRAPVPGLSLNRTMMLVRSSDGITVAVNDLIFNMDLPKDWFGRQTVKLLGSAPGVRVSRIVKLFYCDDKPAFRAELHKLSQIPDLVRLIVGHDSVAHGAEARAALQSAAEQVS